MSYLARLSLANRSIVALATIAVLLFGAVIIPSLKQELFPSIEFPAVSVVSVYPGASPSIVEKDVTDPLEQSFQGLQGLQQLTSSSNEGVSVITIEYNYGTDLDKATTTISQQISKTQANLPSGVTPQVQAFNINDLPVIQLAVSSSQNAEDLAVSLKQNVVPQLQGINGVANVNITGVRNQIVTVTLDLNKMKSQGVSLTQIQGALQADNITLPAGELSQNGQSLAIRVGNTFNSLDDLENVVVGMHTSIPTGGTGSGQYPSAGSTGSGQYSGAGTGSGQYPSAGGTGQFPTTGTQPKVTATPVKLKDVATVQETLSPSTSITRTKGKPSIGIAITKTTDGNTVSISQAVRTMIPDLEKKLGHDAQITPVSDQAPYIQTSVDGLVREGLIGAGFAIVVILLFLFSLRSTLVTAISIPLSVVIALIGLWVGNYSLNILTLGGLTIAIGRVVDDSIVVLENIYRHLSEGDSKRIAVFTGVREVAGAVTASTLTTVSVFLPIAFTGGLVGQLFSSFAITVTIALLASLFVALTIIPVLAYWFLKAPKNAHKSEPEKMSWLERGYIPLIRWTTKYRVITIVLALLILVGTFSLYSRLQTNLFDRSSQNTFSITQQLPVGTSLSQTDQAATKVENILAGISQIQTYQVTIGSNNSFAGFSGSTGSTNVATFSITTDPNADQNAVQQTVKDRVKTLQDAGSITIGGGQQGGFNSSTVNVNVQASDEQTLRQAAQQVQDAISQVANTSDVSSNLSNASPLVDVQVDPEKALKNGLTPAQVGQLLRTIYSGSTVTHVTLNGTQQDVDLFLGSPATSVNDMKNLLIPTATGTVKLSDVANVTQTTGPTTITHINSARTATISATINGSNVGAVSNDIQQKLNKLTLPDGATYSLGGVSSDQQQTFRNLGLALLAAIVLVYLVMVGTFRSLLQPLILLVSIPFAATGSILLLLITNTALGAPALIGLLMLVGIVVTNAIVLLDLVRQYRFKGMDARTAVIEGGRHRLRPILMTAIATILALMPMALGFSSASGFISGPLAIVVIGGLTSSTILTLLLVPTLYVLVEDIRGRANRGLQEEHELFTTEEEKQEALV